MNISVPFSITPDAEDYLRNRLNEMPPEAKPVLMMTKIQTDGEKPRRWFYKGQSFIIAYFGPAEMPKTEYAESELIGRRIAIEPDALKQLAGRTLSLRRVDARYGLMKNTRYVLVADSAPESAVSALETRERTRHIFSILALSILGGFSGMGVLWIMICMLAPVFKFPLEKVLPLIFPLLIAGGILSAIVSFFFFRKVFKTNGRTKFVQEQAERKYLGYGGLDADLSVWIFFGIPTPLIIALVLVLEQFARSVGQKTAVVFVAIMIVGVPVMYFSDRIPRRIVIRLGLLGWALTIAGGYWYFKTYGP